MRIIIVLLIVGVSTAFGQIEQDVNKNDGNVISRPILQIDSIRFNATNTQMEIVLENGSVEMHEISEIHNVTFSESGEPLVFTCGKSTVTFVYRGNSVTYGTVIGANDRCWLDRNLGASQVATVGDDFLSYGDLFQWGRADDGHQDRYSATITGPVNTNNPGSYFVSVTSTMPSDWRSPQNDNLWQGVNGINNPCPSNFRLATANEWQNEIDSWGSEDPSGAFNSSLKLPLAGLRFYPGDVPIALGTTGFYWTSSVDGVYGLNMYMDIYGNEDYSEPRLAPDYRGAAFSVRCIKE